MGDDYVEGRMIEIGDPTEEAAAVEPPPRLVIEYRERGVPWMLIPPMIVLAAVAAVMVYHKLAPPRQVVVRVPSEPIAPGPATATEPPASPPPTEPGPSTATPPEPSKVAASSPPPAAADVPPVEVAAETPREPVTFPRVQGLGFDPNGLVETEPPVDRALAPATIPQDRGDLPAREPAPAVDPGRRDQPEEVDPNVLPVDPREAKRRRELRLVEARRKAEADRGKFHAELRAICVKSRERSAPQIEALCKSYGTEVDPAIQAQAARLLNGVAAGVDRPVRINLLRSLGFSESLILKDIAGNLMTHEDGTARGGVRTADDGTYRAALLLLGHPPTRVASPTRPASNTRAAR